LLSIVIAGLKRLLLFLKRYVSLIIHCQARLQAAHWNKSSACLY